MTAIKFADLDGMNIVTGPADDLEAALAAGGKIDVAGQIVTLIGEIELMEDGTPVCDYAERTRIDVKPRPSRHRKECITGGNCSSHGDGSNCGGYDCDGF